MESKKEITRRQFITTSSSFFIGGFVGIPITTVGAFLFHLPIYFVYTFTLTEEVTKFSLGSRHYFSKKWINDLTMRIEAINPV